MHYIFYLANGLVLPPAMHFAWNYYRFKGKEIKFGSLWMSAMLLGVTVIITSLQFAFHEIITVLNRDRESILSGELWRLITPLFIQPMGIGQCFFNALFFISFVPIAEHLYGYRILLIYFGASLISQMVILYWETTQGGLPTAGGGASTAIYAVMGALYMYVLLNRKTFPGGYFLIPLAGFIGAATLILFEDGHGSSVLLGAFFGILLHRKSKPISSYS